MASLGQCLKEIERRREELKQMCAENPESETDFNIQIGLIEANYQTAIRYIARIYKRGHKIEADMRRLMPPKKGREINYPISYEDFYAGVRYNLDYMEKMRGALECSRKFKGACSP